MKPLNRNTVRETPERPVKILQFGEGNFLRGFVDWMIDILNEQTDFEGNIQIIQPLPLGMGEAINAQDGLYYVLLEGIENGKKVQKTRQITSVKGVLNPYEDYEGFLRLAENPQLEFIFSNTTEAGIAFDKSDTDFKILPNSFPGKLSALLFHRFQYFEGTPPGKLTIIPCELIDKNAEKLKECILQYADHWELPQGFREWILRDVFFCNSLVDRIVPGFPKNQIHEIQQRIGFEDNLVVKAEPFNLWVIEAPEDIRKRLNFQETGLNVIFTDDLRSYRTRKVRILNGAHTAMVPIAYLHGFTEVREVVEDEKMGAFLKQILFDEIIPTIDMPKAALERYAYEVLDRFRNPFIKHALLDIALNSISKFRVRVLPSILTYMERYGKVPEGLATALAYLIVFYRGEYGSESIPIKDDEAIIAFFKTAWDMEDIALTVTTILSNEALWGVNLNQQVKLSDFLKEKITTL